MSWSARLFPHPYLSLSLLIVWLFLHDTLAPGEILVGLIIGLLIPYLTRVFWPESLTLSKPLGVLKLLLRINWDILRANIAVARLILTRHPDRLNPMFLEIPVELEDPHAIVLLAGILTITPGTVAADLDVPNRRILLHVLDVRDERMTTEQIKARYEQPLKEIFG